MKRPSFLHGVVAAAALAFAGSALIAAFTPFVATGQLFRLVVPLITAAYLLYLLRNSAERTGRLTIALLWSALAFVTWWIAPPLPLYVLIHAAAIWLVRSLYFYAGVFPALIDIGLCALSVSAFVWAATSTGSVFIATWSFFLVQALFVAIPPKIGGRPTVGDDPPSATFDQARRRADAALRQLIID